MSFNWPSILKPSEVPAKMDDITRLEKSLGVVLPDDYRRFLLSFNGGKITVNHYIYVPDLACSIFVNRTLPLTKASPFLGVVEARHLQECSKFACDKALRSPTMWAQVFFI